MQRRQLTSIVTAFFQRLGIGLTSTKNLIDLRIKEIEFDSNIQKMQLARSDLSLIFRLLREKSLLEESFEDIELILRESQSQLRQELFCSIHNRFRRGGYFVEFGALDGITGANTLVLEKFFDWSGILAEPNPAYWSSLTKNRNAIVEKVAIGSKKSQNREFLTLGNLSTFLDYQSADSHDRSSGELILVETISLNELLERNAAPQVIDFMSIDTEGSELEIVSEFDFNRYRINFLCVEHNYSSNADLILDIFKSHGYQQIYSDYSYFDFFLAPADSLHAKI